jgi:hypothetical protein
MLAIECLKQATADQAPVLSLFGRAWKSVRSDDSQPQSTHCTSDFIIVMIPPITAD